MVRDFLDLEDLADLKDLADLTDLEDLADFNDLVDRALDLVDLGDLDGYETSTPRTVTGGELAVGLHVCTFIFEYLFFELLVPVLL